MKNLFTSIAISLFFSLVTNAQNPASIAKNSVGYISHLNKNTPGMFVSGTGSLIIKNIDSTHGKVYLVTNRHVLPTRAESDSINFRIKSPQGFVNVEIQIFDKLGNLSNGVKYDADGNDLAVIEITQQYLNHQMHYLDSLLIPYYLLFTKDSIIKYKTQVGDEILFIGFPSLFYDKRNYSPLIRTGIIASVPEDDYYFNDLYRYNVQKSTGDFIPEKLSGFLIDATALHGSSGSLVFTKPNVFNSNGYKNITAVLGIVTFSYPDIDTKTGVHQANVAGVISSSQIKKTIDLFVWK